MRLFERDIYYALNCNSLKEVKALEEYKDAKDKREIFEEIWKNKEVYQGTHFRLEFIAHSIWQIRIAVYFGVIHEDVGWTYLETLANFARPLMTLFSSWEEYHLNIQQFHEVYEFKYQSEREQISQAMVCLKKKEESPFTKIPYEFGINKDYKYNINSHSNIFPKQILSDETPLSLALLELLEQEDKSRLFEELAKLNQIDFEKTFPFLLAKSTMKYIST